MTCYFAAIVDVDVACATSLQFVTPTCYFCLSVKHPVRYMEDGWMAGHAAGGGGSGGGIGVYDLAQLRRKWLIVHIYSSSHARIFLQNSRATGIGVKCDAFRQVHVNRFDESSCSSARRGGSAYQCSHLVFTVFCVFSWRQTRLLYYSKYQVTIINNTRELLELLIPGNCCVIPGNYYCITM